MVQWLRAPTLLAEDSALTLITTCWLTTVCSSNCRESDTWMWKSTLRVLLLGKARVCIAYGFIITWTLEKRVHWGTNVLPPHLFCMFECTCTPVCQRKPAAWLKGWEGPLVTSKCYWSETKETGTLHGISVFGSTLDLSIWAQTKPYKLHVLR